jgi:hypothetical protein
MYAERRATHRRVAATTLELTAAANTVTAHFRLVCVFVALEVGTRRIVDWNLTDQPSAAWTIQRLRMLGSGG